MGERAMSSVELWRAVLAKRPITDAQIELMLQQHVHEDLWLDWKHGKLMAVPQGRGKAAKKDRDEKICRSCAAFMNADGGVLVIGANGGDVGCEEGDTPWELSPIDASEEQRPGLVDAIQRVLAAGIDPPPRNPPTVQFTEEGSVLLIAVVRSVGLVRVFDRGSSKGGALEPRYYMRMHDGCKPIAGARLAETMSMPDCLVADVLMGRRARPALEVLPRTQDQGLFGGLSRKEFALDVINSSLVRADDVRLLLITPGIAFVDHEHHQYDVQSHLGKIADVEGRATVTEVALGPVPPLAVRTGLVRLDLERFEAVGDFERGMTALFTRYRCWRGALLLTATGMLPRYYQLSYEFTEEADQPPEVHLRVSEVARPRVEGE